jgi:hypothetical protein
VSGGGASAPLGVKALQLAAYDALLASLLAPLPSRHPYLAQALGLLAAGAADACPALRALCRGAVAQLEALLRPRAAPLAGVRGYAGAEALPPLTRPRMWSAVDAEVAAAAPPAAVTPGDVADGPVHARTAAAEQQQQQHQQLQDNGERAQSKHKQKQAHKHLNGVQASAPAAGSLRRPADATLNGGVRRVAAPKPAEEMEEEEHQQPEQQQQQPQQQQQHEDEDNDAEHQRQQQQQQPQQPGALTSQPAVATPLAMPAADAAPAAFLGEESSDSEGSLPGIDSGGGSDDDDV